MSGGSRRPRGDIRDLTDDRGRLMGSCNRCGRCLPDQGRPSTSRTRDRTTRRGWTRSASGTARRPRRGRAGGRVMTAEGALLVLVLSLSAIVFAALAVETARW